MLDLSVIIPAYNEERRLPTTLESVHSYLSNTGKNFEILVVDDGSTDNTVNIVEDFGKHHEGIRLLSYSPNQGKGYAVKTGIMAAQGQLLLVNDADGSSPIGEIELLQSAITSGADIAIGSRAKPDSSRVVKALAYRKHMGNTFNLIVQSLLLPGIYDTQCGFKLFKHTVAREIFSLACLNGYAYDVEILYIAKLHRHKIAEVAINWTNTQGSKVNVLTDSAKMLLEILNIKFGAWTGRYKRLIDIKTSGNQSVR